MPHRRYGPYKKNKNMVLIKKKSPTITSGFNWTNLIPDGERFYISQDQTKIVTMVAGVKFEKRQETIEEVLIAVQKETGARHANPLGVNIGIEITPCIEQTPNAYDQNAIRVFFFIKDGMVQKEFTIGFLPRDLSQIVTPYFSILQVIDFHISGNRTNRGVRLLILGDKPKKNDIPPWETPLAKKERELKKNRRLSFGSLQEARKALQPKIVKRKK